MFCAILYSYLEEDHTGLRHGNKSILNGGTTYVT